MITTGTGQPDRINSTLQLRCISNVVVDGDIENVHTLYQKDTHKGVVLSFPLKLLLKKSRSIVTIGGLYNGKDYHGAILEKVIVYSPEERGVGGGNEGIKRAPAVMCQYNLC
ncbi:uncharacterized protein LDX57_007049 [Aspergillus melleus]|uniref:uncharacterized protein n=1 Tax=Aspergillus melleus TaxID=138277 RepID=UPI001E8E88E5|nr:uncharacterized protein LDX57_007049 [Aspergillus melleus]KAH8429385.1 hypothetical protein LDX57_007049 [Aspergillus melleus]